MNGDILIPQVELTADDHDRGYKDVEVESRSGERITVRLTSVPWRDATALMNEVLEKKDQWLVLLRSLPEDQGELLLKKLSPFSTVALLGVAWALAYGSEFQKKIQAAGAEEIQRLIAMTGGERKPSSSGTASPQAMSEAGHCQS